MGHVLSVDEDGAQIGVVFKTATPFDKPRDTPRVMAEWLAWYRYEHDTGRPYPLLLIGLSLRIVEFARDHGRITMGDAIKLTGVSRNTLKQHFRALVEQGHLNQQGSGRGVWYELK